MSRYFSGQGYQVNELPSNENLFQGMLANLTSIQNQKAANRNRTLNTVIGEVGDLGNAYVTNRMQFAEGDSFKENILTADDALYAKYKANADANGLPFERGMAGTMSEAQRNAYAKSRLTGASHRALLPFQHPFQTGREARLEDQTYGGIAARHPNLAVSDTIAQNTLSGGVIRGGNTVSTGAQVNIPQEPVNPGYSNTTGTPVQSTQATTSSMAPIKHVPGQPITAGVSFTNAGTSPNISGVSAPNPFTEPSNNPALFQKEKGDITGKELSNTLATNQVAQEQNNLQRIATNPTTGQNVVSFNGVPSNIPVDDDVLQLVKIGQNQAVGNPQQYQTRQDAVMKSAEKMTQFYRNLDIIENGVNKYGDLVPLWTAVYGNPAANSTKLTGLDFSEYSLKAVMTQYPGMTEREARDLTQAVQALLSYRPTLAREGGEVGNLNTMEQEVYNYIAGLGGKLYPEGIQSVRASVNRMAANPLFQNGIMYNVEMAANFGDRLRKADPSNTTYEPRSSSVFKQRVSPFRQAQPQPQSFPATQQYMDSQGQNSNPQRTQIDIFKKKFRGQ